MLAAILGLIAGLVLGLTGAGGSVLAVPLLMWGMGWTLPQAAPVALLAVSVSATLGTYTAWSQKIVRYRAALVMAATGMVTAPLGLKTAALLPLDLLTGLFAVVLVLIAARLWQQTRGQPEETRVVRAALQGAAINGKAPLCELNPDTGRLRWTRPCTLAIIGSGTSTGFLAGLLGVGGGFIIVPALRLFTNLPFHSAVATSLMAIALTSAGTAAISIASGHDLPWLIALPFMAGAIAGMLAGRILAPKVAGPRLQQGFALLMLLVAVGMGLKAAGILPF